MTPEEPNPTEKIETVKKIYQALNQNKVDEYLNFFAPDVERFESFGSRSRGLEGLKANFTQGRDTWAEGGCEPEKFNLVNDKVVVFVHVKVRQKNKTEWVDGHVTDIFTFKGAKVVQFYSFADRDEALKWSEGSAKL